MQIQYMILLNLWHEEDVVIVDSPFALAACCEPTKFVFVVTPLLGDITRFFTDGTRFSNLSASQEWSFCDSSNRLLGSLLVMFLRARRWPVGPCVFYIHSAKQTLLMSTFVLRVAEIVQQDGLARTVYRAAPGPAHH